MNDAFDHGRVAAIAQGSGASQGDILAEFRCTTAADARQLRDAAQKSDFTQLEHLAHRIRGASLMLGAHPLADACSLIATVSRSSDEAQVRTALGTFERQLAALDDWLDGSAGQVGASGPSVTWAGAEPLLPLCSDLKFMVVEDHEFQQGVLIRLLRRLGAEEVQGFADSASAIRAMEDAANLCDIVVLALALPGMGRLKLLRKIGAAKRPVSVILNSALSPELLAKTMLTARNHGVALLGEIGKPLTEAKLAPLIALHRSSLKPL